MSQLLDALKKAGLADEKKRKQAEREKRAQEHRELKASKKHEPIAEPTADPEALKAEAAAITLQRLRQIIEGGLVDDAGGRRRFHFEAADGRISFLNVSEIIGLQLERGKVAIVQQPEDAELHVLVTRDAAIKVTEVEPQLLRFLVRN